MHHDFSVGCRRTAVFLRARRAIPCERRCAVSLWLHGGKYGSRTRRKQGDSQRQADAKKMALRGTDRGRGPGQLRVDGHERMMQLGGRGAAGTARACDAGAPDPVTVSYTHLTLPTICSV
eukprot:5064206-Prymnesium_polylepis.2